MYTLEDLPEIQEVHTISESASLRSSWDNSSTTDDFHTTCFGQGESSEICRLLTYQHRSDPGLEVLLDPPSPTDISCLSGRLHSRICPRPCLRCENQTVRDENKMAAFFSNRVHQRSTFCGSCEADTAKLTLAGHSSSDRSAPRSGQSWLQRGGAASRLVLVTVCLVALVGCTESRPPTEAATRYRELHTHAVKYLAQFGYLKGPSRETQNLRSQEDLTRAIMSLQKAGGIPQTGVVDSRTETLMFKPRCGNTDDFIDESRGMVDVDDDRGFRIRRKRYTVATSKWPRTNITFRFVNYTPDMPQVKTRQLISDALRVWSDATPLSFTEVRDSTADIMIMFASQYHSDGYPFDGKGMVLGHAFFPGHGKGGDTHFDDDEHWTTNSSDGVDLFMVAAHEFGHALGLAHSGDPSALMYPWYMGFEGKFQLPDDDFRGITSLYGSVEQDRTLPKARVNLIPSTNSPSGRGDQRPSVEPTVTSGTKTTSNSSADPCSSPIDAITVYRTEIFLFIGKFFWRLDSRKVIKDDSDVAYKPIEIHKFWYGLPKELEKIDAVFERSDNKLVFFSGDRYWVFNANHLINGFPSEGRPITEFNIPADVKNIDAAFVWGYNKRTYLISGDMYWKMNENNTFVEYDYPRDMGTWKGVPVPVDAAFKDLSDRTIFFQGLDFWEFHDMRMKVRNGYPKRISQHWLQCPGVAQRVEQKGSSASRLQSNDDDEDDEDDDDDVEDKSDARGGTQSVHKISQSVALVIVLIVCRLIERQVIS